MIYTIQRLFSENEEMKIKTATRRVMKQTLRNYSMSEGNTCIAEPNLVELVTATGFKPTTT